MTTDRGIQNNHRAQIECSRAGFILAPGKNRLTSAQYSAFKADKLMRSYLKVGLLSEVPVPASDSEEHMPSAQDTSTDGRLNRLSLEELRQMAKKHKINVDGPDGKPLSRKDLIKLISPKLPKEEAKEKGEPEKAPEDPKGKKKAS